ncbi:hypothetical protein FUAX_27220 [Fulvitalea axinellae]|uniref:PAS domain S-box protein n=1 Tax=Fulvitalea axinellae TaxID=1182444 RepID=A0AAU9DCZ6_9BACT|nr:hypothetical protein FUAX_27220 [Fulvitalea axinellae]
MFGKIRIGGKIALAVTSVVIVAVVIVGVITVKFVRQNAKKQNVEMLQSVNALKSRWLEDFFKRKRTDLRRFLKDDELAEALDEMELADGDPTEIAYAKLALEEICNHLLGLETISATRLLDKDGNVVFEHFNEASNSKKTTIAKGAHRDLVAVSKGQLVFTKPIKSGKKFLVNTVGRVGLDDFHSDYHVVFTLDVTSVFDYISNKEGLGETGETMIAMESVDKAEILSPLRHAKASEVGNVYFNDGRNRGLQRSVKGGDGTGEYQDYRGKTVWGVWAHVPSVKWGIVTKIDKEEAEKPIEGLIWEFAIGGFFIAVLAICMAILFSRLLINPLLSLKDVLGLLAKGILPNKVPKKTDDEIGEMAKTVGDVVKSLKRTAEFAYRIGEGKYDADYNPQSKHDTLGTSLINMRDSIQASEARDKERNWIVLGVAEVGNILRQHDSLEVLGDEILEFITKKINAIQGAFYVVEEDGDRPVIDMKASYAYSKKKYLKAEFKFAEGLVGQAAAEQDMVLRTEVPEDYMHVTSGLLGDAKPSCILVVPLITEEKVYGVLELAGFERFDERSIKFVQEISLIIARTIFNIKVNARTVSLLNESRKMSDELREKQEILRQNAEEMQATQEELQMTNRRLEDQIEQVNMGQTRMQLLWENASEIVTIYEQDGTIRYVSPSVERIVGYGADELVGTHHVKHAIGEGKDAFARMFTELIERPNLPSSGQYAYERKDGDTVMMEATGVNRLSDPAVRGIIINSRDITERQRAEREERMRSKMQSLSENSPDLIARLDPEGNFFYINPTIETYTGETPNHYQKRGLNDVNLPEPIVNAWNALLGNVNESRGKIHEELAFPSLLGDRMTRVNAIPEFDETENIESVLLVSHDITEQKKIESEIKSKNKKITESINYASRIQDSILPNQQHLRNALPESFVLYKAKDVVSGDFPWFVEADGEIFIAAVDCTGHGVPGALISLIGYFLLNDIVTGKKIKEPGRILDLLDDAVTKTLRQDEEGAITKDGMDIALCRINKATGKVQFAGAHRPLYVIRNGELEQIKGDKFPIGGGKYRNQTHFTNHEVETSKGDAIYFCSDGFPDQFGGPLDRKFGPKRLRERILAHSAEPMDAQVRLLDQEWEEWKGDGRQTDDMLLIGIRF